MNKKNKVIVAATQMSCSWELDDNIEKAKKIVKSSAADGANIILLQELFQRPYFCIDYDENQDPIYKTFPGWKTQISKIKTFVDLPKEAQEYILFIEIYLRCPVDIISVGPSRDQTIYKS